MNFNGTTVKVGYNSEGSYEVYYIDDRKDGLKWEEDEENNQLTCLYIKYYLLMHAYGAAAKPVFVIADENMKEDDISVFKEPGFGTGVDYSSYGWAVFCKSTAFITRINAYIHGFGKSYEYF